MYGQLVDLVRSWFNEHPVYDERNQPISVPEWSFRAAVGWFANWGVLAKVSI